MMLVQLFCVFQLSAIDSDAGPNGQVNYRILAGDQGHFLIGTRSIKGGDGHIWTKMFRYWSSWLS